jgi:hypothetical protein
MEQIGGDINELMDYRKCSPLVVYGIFAGITLISMYWVRMCLQKYNSYKMDNLFTLFSTHEAKLLVVLGVVIYGMCQYNKDNLAWIFLLIPLVYIIIQNILIFIHVVSALHNSPNKHKVVLNEGYGNMAGAGAGIMPQNTSPQQPKVPPPPVPKQPAQTDFVYPTIGGNTSMSSPLNGSPAMSSLGGNPF